MEVNANTIVKLSSIADAYRDKTVLITGATGMIGQNVVAILLSMNDCFQTNISILAHGRNEGKAKKVFSEYATRKDLKYCIQDVKALDVKEHIDFIIHTAGITGGSKQHLDYPMCTILTAIDGTRKVLDLALRNQAATIFLSSLEVYGYTGIDKQEIRETDCGYIDCTNVRSSYSESKRMCECMYASYAKQYGINTYIARLTATFGQGVSYADNRVFSQFAHSIIDGRDIVLKSTGETVRNYCDAEDAASAILTILVNGQSGEAYNVANMDTEISIKDMALKFTQLFPKSHSNVVFDLSSDVTTLGYNKVMRNVVNSDKLKAIGWNPIFNMDDMISRLINHLRNCN